MKKILFLLSALLIFGCTNNNYKNSLEQENLKGNVKIIVFKSYEEYEEKFGEPSGSGSVIKETFDFDKNGNLKQVGVNRAFEDYIIKYEYDDRNFLIIKDIYKKKGLLRRFKFNYYDDGKLKSMEGYSSDGQYNKLNSDFYEYKENGMVEIKDGNGDLTRIITFENNLKRISSDDGTYVNEFNENGDLDKKIKYGNISEQYKYLKFDNEGNWLERYAEDNNGNKSDYSKREIIYY